MNKLKKQPIKWEKVLTNSMSEKGLMSGMCKELTIQQQKPKQPNWTKELDRHSFKEDLQIGQ